MNTKELIEQIDRRLEIILESDPRTMSDRECEYGYVFDRIAEIRKLIKENT